MRRAAGSVALFCFLLASPAVQAHLCGPLEITVEVGKEVDWRITADLLEIETDYTPQLGGTDSAIATVTPALPFKAHNGDFKIRGVTAGETVFTADWFYAATGAGGTCAVTIKVVPEGTRVDNPFGLPFPDSTINFDEVPLAENEPILNVFSGCGVEFSSGVLYDTDSEGGVAVRGNHAKNAPQSGGDGLIGFPKANPFTIRFTDAVSSVAIGLRGSPPGTMITALFEGDVVDSLLAPTTIDADADRFFGFNEILCDELRIENLGDGTPPSTPEFAGFVRLDNVQFSLAEVEVTPLEVGNPVNFELLACKRTKVFEVSPPLEGPLVLTLSDPEPSNGNALYFRWGEVPTPMGFDHAADTRSEASQRLVIPGHRDERAFVLVRGNVFSDGTNEITLLAQTGELFLERMSADFAGRGGTGQLSTSVLGGGFDEGMEFRLEPSGGGESILASDVVIVAADRAEVLLDLVDAPIGFYDLTAERADGLTATLEETFEVVDTSMGPILEVSLGGVPTSRYDRPSSMTLRYRNVGDAEMTAPLFKIVGPPDTRLRLAREDEFPEGDQAEVLQVLGIHPGAIPGKLAPGAEVEIPLEFRTRTCLDCDTTFEVFVFTPTEGDFVGWDELDVPAGMSDATWQEVWPDLSVNLGGTWSEVHAALSRLATRLSRRGVYGASVPELFRFAVRETLGRPSASIRGHVRTEEGRPQFAQFVLALEEGVVKSSTSTDEEGAFALDWLERGAPYELAVVDHRIVESSFGGTEVRVPASGELPAVELVTVPEPNGLTPACPNCDESGLPAESLPLPEGLFTRVTHWDVSVVSSWDPNDKNGPQGVEAENLIAPEGTIEYTIHFENKAQASAAAQVVTVTDDLDPDLDWSTFRFGDVKIGFNEAQIWSLDDIGQDLFSGYERNRSSERYSGVRDLGVMDLSEEPETEELVVVLDTSINLQTGIVVWTFLTLTSDPLLGFLPPNCSEDCPDCSQVSDEGVDECKDGRGEAQVSFTIEPEKEIEEGTEIENNAIVQFDNLDELDVEHHATISYFLPPEEPRNPRPRGALEPGESSVVLQWESRRARSFDVFLWKDGDERPPDPVARDLAERFFVLPEALPAETDYLWTVVAKNANGEASPAAPWQLTRAAPCVAPPVPTSPVPSDGELDVRHELERLDWESGAGSGVHYAVFLWPADEERPAKPLVTGLRSSDYALRAPLRTRTSYHWQVTAFREGCETPGPVWSFKTPVPFERGDANADGAVNVSDPIFTLDSIFQGARDPDCQKSADANDDGVLDVSDAVYGLHVLAGEAVLPPPVAECGVDPTEDALSCEGFGVCE